MPLSRIKSWALLLGYSLLLGGGAHWAGLPAAALLGPMAASAFLSIRGIAVRVPRELNIGAQALIGCIIAMAITPQSIRSLLSQLPLLLALVGVMLAASTGLGVLASRRGMLPGSTALWGLSPGAAAVMILMAEEFGADARLVAFMQYLRLAFVALVAALFSWLFFDASPMRHASLAGFLAIDARFFAVTAAIAAVGAWVGIRLRIPAGMMLVPMALATVLQATNATSLQVPGWLQVASFAVLGWHIGLPFTLTFCRHALRLLPNMLLFIFGMMAVCGACALALVLLFGVDPLTAFLATAPGGMDSMAVIAASSRADIVFVMGFQMFRFVVVLFLAPLLARWARRWSCEVNPPPP